MRRLSAEVSSGWNEFFHAPCDARVLAVLRIGFASLVLLHGVSLLPDVTMFWSVSGMVPLSSLQCVADGFAPTLFSVLPNTDVVVWLGYVLARGPRLTVARRLPFSVSDHRRFGLAWSPFKTGTHSFVERSGRPLETHRRLSRLRPAGSELLARPALRAQRFCGCTVLSAALRAGSDRRSSCSRLGCGSSAAMIGRRGTALYYVTRLDGFWGNLPLPAGLSSSPVFLRAGTFATLAIELSVPHSDLDTQGTASGLDSSIALPRRARLRHEPVPVRAHHAARLVLVPAARRSRLDRAALCHAEPNEPAGELVPNRGRGHMKKLLYTTCLAIAC